MRTNYSPKDRWGNIDKHSSFGASVPCLKSLDIYFRMTGDWDADNHKPVYMDMKNTSEKSETFDPEDQSRVKYTQVGVWDLYEELPRELQDMPAASHIEELLEIKQNLPYLWRLFHDIMSLKNCRFLLAAYVFLQLLVSFVPALSLWFVLVFYRVGSNAYPSIGQVFGSDAEDCDYVSLLSQLCFLLVSLFQVQEAVDTRTVDTEFMSQQIAAFLE